VSEITRAKTGTDPLSLARPALTSPSKLRVVPGVEALCPELYPAATRFAEHELLEQGEIPVVTTRTTDSTIGEIAPSARSWCRK